MGEDEDEDANTERTREESDEAFLHPSNAIWKI